jgi:hypothetical protein
MSEKITDAGTIATFLVFDRLRPNILFTTFLMTASSLGEGCLYGAIPLKYSQTQAFCQIPEEDLWSSRGLPLLNPLHRLIAKEVLVMIY